MLDAVYVDARQSKRVVAIRPKPPFRPIIQLPASREGSDVRIVNEPLDGSSVLLVETGENQPLPETMLTWLGSASSCETVAAWATANPYPNGVRSSIAAIWRARGVDRGSDAKQNLERGLYPVRVPVELSTACRGRLSPTC